METFPQVDEADARVASFEVENAYLSPRTCARIVAAVPGASEVRVRRPFSRWDEIHVRFRFRDAECVVQEPFGDNSRFWIGRVEASPPVDLAAVERAFKAYQPPIHRQVIGDILTLRFLKKLLG